MSWKIGYSLYQLVLHVFKSLDEGFSTFSMVLVCACLNPPPCIKGAFFSPSSKVLVSHPYSWKTFPCSKDFSRPSVFPQWRFALKAAKKIKNKIKSRRQTHTPGKNTCDRTLQICIKHAMCFSHWYVPVLIFYFFYFYFFSPEVLERNPWNFFPRRSRRGTLETLLLVFPLRRISSSILETDTWPEQDHKRESTLAQTFDVCINVWVLLRYAGTAKMVYIYIDIHTYVCLDLYSTMYLHWWSLRLQCQVNFWLTRKFQWNSYSKWQYRFQVTVPAQVIAIFFAYFIVICSIAAQARQPFYRYNCLVRLLRCFLHMVLCPFGYHDELILT